jgi:hypothetical protein
MNKLLFVLFVVVAWPILATLAGVPVILPLQLVSELFNTLFRALNLPIRLP